MKQEFDIKELGSGTHDLFLILKSGEIKIDWLKFDD